MLVVTPDGSWSLLDSGSANGTLLNGRDIATGDLINLREGEQDQPGRIGDRHHGAPRLGDLARGSPQGVSELSVPDPLTPVLVVLTS